MGFEEMVRFFAEPFDIVRIANPGSSMISSSPIRSANPYKHWDAWFFR